MSVALQRDVVEGRGADATQGPVGALSIRGVGKSFRLPHGTVEVLRDIDLEVQPGEFVTIVGASGCGKSSLLRLVVGLDHDYRGNIRVDDQPVLSTSLDRGIVFQDHRLLPWMTVARNVGLALQRRALSREARRELAVRSLEQVHLADFADAYPHQLSGGMAQRAAIARAHVNEPKLLLLDESFGALDALTRLKLQIELQHLRERTQCTVVMVTHDAEEAVFLGDRIVVMDSRPGRIRKILPVPFPRPRDRASPVFAQLKQQLVEELLLEP